MKPPTRIAIIDLAIRLGRHEYVGKEWILYPAWVAPPPYREDMLEQAARIRQQAEAILKGDIPPPVWMVEEDAVTANPEPPPEPAPVSRADYAVSGRVWAKASAVARVDRNAMFDLAIRLGQHDHVVKEWILYPAWASPPREGAAMLNIGARYREWAAAILAGEAEPPAWMVEEDEARRRAEMPPQPAPIPVAERLRPIREYPVAAAYAIHSLFQPRVHRARPPPLPRWPSPRRGRDGRFRPAAPGTRVRRSQIPVSAL